jgi:phosphoglucosamine mutase
VADGDHILGICALALLRRGRLPHKTVVGTVMTNLGLEVALKRAGIKLVRAAVGDRYVLEEMKKGGYILGGEQSGHLVFLNYATTGDGILTALRLLTVMIRENKPLAELAGFMEDYPQVLINLEVREKQDLQSLRPARQALREAERRLGHQGRLLVRYSGTEAKLRIMTEGEDRQLVERVAQKLAQTLDALLN